MKALVHQALVTSTILLLIAVSLYSWWNLSGIDEGVSGELPAGLRSEVLEISDPDRLRELAIMLIDSRDAYSQDVQELLGRVIDFLLIIAIMGTVFIWLCTLCALKQMRAQQGQRIGWLRWF